MTTLRRLRRDWSPRQVSPEDVAAAWMVADWLQAHALAAFDRMGTDPVVRRARKYLGWIHRNLLSEFSLKDLHDNHRDLKHSDEALPALGILEDRGFIRRQPATEEPRKRGRKPSPAFFVNPLTHSRNSQNSRNSDAASSKGEFRENREFGDPESQS